MHRSPFARIKIIRFNTHLHKICTTTREMRGFLPKGIGLLIRDRVIAVHRFESYTLRQNPRIYAGLTVLYRLFYTATCSCVFTHLSVKNAIFAPLNTIFCTKSAQNLHSQTPFVSAPLHRNPVAVSAQNLHKMCFGGYLSNTCPIATAASLSTKWAYFVVVFIL